MAIFKEFVYSKTSTEIEFMQGLIDLICADGNITCEDAEGNPTTAEEQFADLTSESRAAFYFNFGDGCRLSLTRGQTNNNNANTYTGGPYIDNINPTTFFMYNTASATAVATRTFFIRLIKSENLFYLGIGDFNFNTSRIILFHCKADNLGIYGISGFNQDLLSATLQSSDSSQIKYKSILPYSAEAGKIDYIEKAVFVSGVTKALETEEIYSCSTMPQYASIALPDGRNFFTISANAMIEVEEEE